MKKLFNLLFLLIVCLCLISCNKTKQNTDKKVNKNNTTTTETKKIDLNQSISISDYKDTFEFGDFFDSSSLVVTLHTEGKDDVDISNKVNVDSSNYISNKLGTYTINVSYESFVKTYEVEVVKRTGIKILMIGNSFSEDATTYANEIAISLGLDPENVLIATVVFGGCTINQHVAFARGDQETYAFHHYENGKMTIEQEWKLSDALAYADWDFVSFQQSSPIAGILEQNTNIISLVRYVKKIVPETTKMVWHETWSYEQGSGLSGLKAYNDSEIEMYNAIIDTTRDYIVPNSEIDLVVPNAVTIQLARALKNEDESKMFESLNRDGFHLSLTYGRFASGMTLVCALTGYTADEITYYPETMEASKIDALKEVVSKAVQNPYLYIEPNAGE